MQDLLLHMKNENRDSCREIAVCSSNGINRIPWIESLKGISCVLIFFHHFLLFFYPRTYWGELSEFPINVPYNLEEAYLNSPLSFFTNGNFLVCIFLLLSSFVLCYQVNRKPSLIDCSKQMLKRYPQLSVPLFIISFITYLMMKLNVFDYYEVNRLLSGSFWAENRFMEMTTFADVVRSSFVDVWITGGSPFSSAFWMLNYVFIGNILAFFVTICTFGVKKRWKWVVYVIGTVLLVAQRNTSLFFYLPAIGGVLLYDEYVNTGYDEKRKSGETFLYVLVCVLGCIVGGFPTATSPKGIFVIFPNISPTIIHIIGAILLCYGLMKLSPKFMENKLLVNLGTISYPFYLIHFQMLFSGTQLIFSFMYRQMGFGYITSTVISGIISLLVCILMSLVIHITVIYFVKKVSNIIISNIVRTERNIS